MNDRVHVYEIHGGVLWKWFTRDVLVRVDVDSKLPPKGLKRATHRHPRQRKRPV